MPGVDELDDVPDAASRDAYAERWRRDARQRFREKHGRDPKEEEINHSILSHRTIILKEQEGREHTLDEYTAICESECIPAAHLQSYLVDRAKTEMASQEGPNPTPPCEASAENNLID